MTPIFVDTNVFVRHFAQDIPRQSALATAFLMRAEAGSIEITITESVMLEIEHILTSRVLPYQVEREGVVKAMRAILGLAGLKLPAADRVAYQTAVDIYEQHPIDFGDALVAGRMMQCGANQIASFDRHFDRLAQVSRIELEPPGP